MRLLLACMLCLPLAARAEPSAAVSAPPSAQAPSGNALPLRARLDRDTIRAAIAGLEEEKDPYPRRHEADTISVKPLEAFSRDFAKARLPDCLHSEGLRNQPTFLLSGVVALPFIAVAKLRGVCR
jgi:hypothetical protein